MHSRISSCCRVISHRHQVLLSNRFWIDTGLVLVAFSLLYGTNHLILNARMSLVSSDCLCSVCSGSDITSLRSYSISTTGPEPLMVAYDKHTEDLLMIEPLEKLKELDDLDLRMSLLRK